MKLLHIVGARPQFIKTGPLLRAIVKQNAAHSGDSIHNVLVHTGQHYDRNMSQVFFEELQLREPDYHLGVGSGSHGHQTGEMLKRIEDVLVRENPDIVVVYGDTNSTLAGALAAAKLHQRVAHVEAGLRSFNKKMPEEMNRVVTDHVADILLCPTQTAVKNLADEGITYAVSWVGDVMYDSVLYNVQLAEQRSQIVSQLALHSGQYALATIHRAENTDQPERLCTIMQALNDITKRGVPIVVPLHPRTKQVLTSQLNFVPDFTIIEPVSYLDMLLLEKHAQVILTDSGGVQKEAFFLGVPCVTLREETEWVETVEVGGNILVGTDRTAIVEQALRAQPPPADCAIFGTGEASEHIVQILIAACSS